jgi:hypothetical protein
MLHIHTTVRPKYEAGVRVGKTFMTKVKKERSRKRLFSRCVSSIHFEGEENAK